MKTAVKFMMMLSLLILFFSVGGPASTVTVCADSSSDTYQVSESSFSSSNDTMVHSGGDINSGILQALSISYVELGAKLLGERNTSSNSLRLRRMLEMSSFLKDIISHLSLRESLVVIDKSKSFLSDMESHYSQSSCDYYIFALRRIVV